MIYNCWMCGWRINERHKMDKHGNVCRTSVADNQIGKHLVCEGKPFCSKYCVEDYNKQSQFKKNMQASPQDYWENGVWGNWKVERKINRSPRPKRK